MSRRNARRARFLLSLGIIAVLAAATCITALVVVKPKGDAAAWILPTIAALGLNGAVWCGILGYAAATGADMAPGWLVVCTACGRTRKLGDIGGVRIGSHGRGASMCRVSCDSCGVRGWHLKVHETRLEHERIARGLPEHVHDPGDAEDDRDDAVEREKRDRDAGVPA